MRHRLTVLVTAAAAVAAAAPTAAAQHAGLALDVLVGGATRPEYHARGATYVEALQGREYTLRLTNPLPVRVAVALSVDGLNTIDARHGDARGAAKWVLDPHETIEISGWQVSGREARAFYFTGERDSYGARLGETENLGVIEAVFFREKNHVAPVVVPGARGEAAREGAAPGAPRPALSKSAAASALADEYAATGIGERYRHEVVRVHVDLEPDPAATIRLRYEFRPELVKLGVLPAPARRTPLERREGARGFEPGFCPDPAPGR